MNRFPYRMHWLYLGFFLVTTGALCYGTWLWGAPGGFSTSGWARFWTTLLFAVPLSIALRPPGLKHIVLYEDRIVVPNLFNPFVCHDPVYFKDLVDIGTELRSQWLGLQTIELVTPQRTVRIYPDFLRRTRRGIGKSVVEDKLMTALLSELDRNATAQGGGSPTP